MNAVTEWEKCFKSTFHLFVFYTSTQEFLESEGIILNEPEPMPDDPYSKRRENPQPSFTTPSEFDQTYKFLTLDRKVMEINSYFNLVFVSGKVSKTIVGNCKGFKEVQYVLNFLSLNQQNSG